MPKQKEIPVWGVDVYAHARASTSWALETTLVNPALTADVTVDSIVDALAVDTVG